MPPSDKPARDVSVDAVLPPDGKRRPASGRKAAEQSEAARIVAKWMDELIRIPGTNFRIGLDAIIGLLPGIGDFLASSVGLVTLAEGVRLRLPASALIRMGGNILVNAAIGTIPGIGDVFSAWFRSNSRNLKLIHRWKTGEKKAVQRGSRFFAILLLCVVAGLAVAWLVLWIMILKGIFGGISWLFGGGG